MFQGSVQIRDAYRDTGVAGRYVEERFVEPLGALLHARQVACLTRVLQETAPRRVLEIAPGPARLTADVAAFLGPHPVLIDASAQMLAEARRRLGAKFSEKCEFVHGDAFSLPFASMFDCVYTFRLIRHFEGADRRRLYAQIARVLRPGGILVFDAVNEEVSEPVRRRAPGQHRHYDALFRREALERELKDAGFNVVDLHGVQRRYPLLSRLQVLVAPRSRLLARSAMEMVDRMGGGPPLEWVVTCTRA
jgi:ubiquinone/menaquinone biosynthesis C-methylase UbiE